MTNKKHSKLTLIVDGNWLLMSRFSIINANNQGKHIDDIMKETCLLMVKSINIAVHTFPLVDNIIFVSDGGSWRNSLKIPDFLQVEHVEYKGNRIKDDNINWKVVFEKFNEFSHILTKNGITTSQSSNVEGDDWCWYWSNRLNNTEHTNCIIWSRDKDLTQLVKRNSDGFFTVCWSKESGLILPQSNEDDTCFLMNMWYSDNDQILNDVIKNAVKSTEINSKRVVIDKIIRGDLGDNVIPIIYRQTKSKQFRVGQKDIPENINVYDNTEVYYYISNLLESKSYKGKVNKSIDDIINHWNYNRRLVDLNKCNYPNNILEKFNEEDLIEINITTDLKNIENELQAKRNDLEDILMSI